MDDWAEIRRLFSTGTFSKREIAKVVGVSRGTVDRALVVGRVPKYQRPAVGSSFDPFAAQVRVLLAQKPRMSATVLADRVGWSGASSVFRQKVAELRPEYLPPDPADRLDHEPGAQVQCDLWFPHEGLPLGHDQVGIPPVLVMTSSFSGFIQARMIPSRTTPDLLGGMWSLIQDAGAVPGRLLWDNESGIGRGKLTDGAAAFAGVLGTQIKLLKARDPESKGVVERMNRFFRQRFMPGRVFASPLDFNTQMAAWLLVANTRHSRSRRGRPADLVIADRARMRALSPVVPDTMFHNTVRLPRDYYVRVFTNDYSVDPTMIGRLVDVSADLSTVTVRHNGVIVASHPRVWARQLTIKDPAHVATAAVLRAQFQAITSPWPKPVPAVVVQTRDLAIYDDIFSTPPASTSGDPDNDNVDSEDDAVSASLAVA